MTPTPTTALRLSAAWPALMATLTAVAWLASPALAHAQTQQQTTLLGANTQVFGLNNQGVAAGVRLGDSGQQGFTWQNGAFTYLTGPAGALSTAAFDVSDTGVVVGHFTDSLVTDPQTGEQVSGPTKGFVYQDGSYASFTVAGAADTFLRGISADARYLTGYYLNAEGLGVGFVFDTQNNQLINLSKSDSLLTIAQGINNLGMVAGSDVRQGPTGIVRQGFLFDVNTGVRTDFATPGYVRTAFRDVSNHGWVGGWGQRIDATTNIAVADGFLGGPGAFTVFNQPGATDTFVQGLNDIGGFAGSYTVAGVQYGFISSPVPEAPAALLLLAGLAGLAWRRRRG